MRRSKGLKALAMAVPLVLAVETTGAQAAGERFLGRGDAERWGRGGNRTGQSQYAGIFEGGKEQAAAAAELVDFGLISETQDWVRGAVHFLQPAHQHGPDDRPRPGVAKAKKAADVAATLGLGPGTVLY
jgi:hypothetical protein